MASPQANPRQPLVAAWAAQMVGTIVIAFAVVAFVKSLGGLLSDRAAEYQRYAMTAILLAALPAIGYLRRFKANLLADEAALQRTGVPDPQIRPALMRSLSLGGALCELPMALGVLNLLMGGDTRWFIGATFITIAIRLSYRPFLKLKPR